MKKHTFFPLVFLSLFLVMTAIGMKTNAQETYVAQIGSEKFTTLEEAILADKGTFGSPSQTPTEITLLTDINTDTISIGYGQNISIDLAGYTLKASVCNYGTLSLLSKAERKGKIISEITAVETRSILNIDNIEITGKEEGIIIIEGESVTVNNCIISGCGIGVGIYEEEIIVLIKNSLISKNQCGIINECENLTLDSVTVTDNKNNDDELYSAERVYAAGVITQQPITLDGKCFIYGNTVEHEGYATFSSDILISGDEEIVFNNTVLIPAYIVLGDNFDNESSVGIRLLNDVEIAYNLFISTPYNLCDKKSDCFFLNQNYYCFDSESDGTVITDTPVIQPVSDNGYTFEVTTTDSSLTPNYQWIRYNELSPSEFNAVITTGDGLNLSEVEENTLIIMCDEGSTSDKMLFSEGLTIMYAGSPSDIICITFEFEGEYIVDATDNLKLYYPDENGVYTYYLKIAPTYGFPIAMLINFDESSNKEIKNMKIYCKEKTENNTNKLTDYSFDKTYFCVASFGDGTKIESEAFVPSRIKAQPTKDNEYTFELFTDGLSENPSYKWSTMETKAITDLKNAVVIDNLEGEIEEDTLYIYGRSGSTKNTVSFTDDDELLIFYTGKISDIYQITFKCNAVGLLDSKQDFTPEFVLTRILEEVKPYYEFIPKILYPDDNGIFTIKLSKYEDFPYPCASVSALKEIDEEKMLSSKESSDLEDLLAGLVPSTDAVCENIIVSYFLPVNCTTAKLSKYTIGDNYMCTAILPDKSTLDSIIFTAEHVHGFTYKADKNTITATCGNGDGGHSGSLSETLTILAPTSPSYDGTEKAASIKDNKESIGNIDTLPDIQYQKKTGESTYASETTDAPIEAGTYRASITVDKNKTAYVEYTILKGTPEYKTPSGLTATEGQILSDITLPDGFAFTEDGTTSVGEIGQHIFHLSYTPDDTDNYNIVNNIEVIVTVKPNCVYFAPFTTGEQTLTFSGIEAGLYTVSGNCCKGYTLMKDGRYVASVDGKVVTDSNTAYTWKYDGGLYTEVKIATKSKFLFWSYTTNKTVKQYLTIKDGLLVVSDSKASVQVLKSENEHTYEYIHDGDGKHEAYCIKCGKHKEAEAHVFDEETHYCVCGMYDSDCCFITVLKVIKKMIISKKIHCCFGRTVSMY